MLEERFPEAENSARTGGAAAATDPRCSKVADYALAILAPSVASFDDDFINDNVNSINTYAAGFMKFCSSAIGLSEDEWVEACNLFYTNSMSLDPLEAVMHFRCAEAIMKTPEGDGLFKAGQTAAWLCQEGNTADAVAALGKALAA